MALLFLAFSWGKASKIFGFWRMRVRTARSAEKPIVFSHRSCYNGISLLGQKERSGFV